MNGSACKLIAERATPDRGQHDYRHVAVLAADVVNYAGLTERAPEDTYLRLRGLRVNIIDPCIVSFRGQVIKNTGDGFLAVFDSPLDAVRCAAQLQERAGEQQAGEGDDRKLRFRIGLHAGEVITEDEDIYGNTVNIAARVEQYAPPDGVVFTEPVYAHVKPSLERPVEDLGTLRLKNIAQPVRAFVMRKEISHLRVADLSDAKPAQIAKVPSITVLPFRTDGSHEDAYLGEGMVDDIILELASIKGLLVISRTSTLAYKSGPIDVRKIGQDLGVSYVLSGSVRRLGERLRIGAELAEVESGAVIWADRYDGDASELFELQDRIATRIVWSLAPNVREAELKRAMRKRPENVNAYDLLMRAIASLYRMNADDFARAGELLKAAIAADDSYATAYAYAALWAVHRVNQGWTDNQGEDSAEAARLAAAAVERDPADGFALAIYGHTKAVLFRDYPMAKALFESATLAAPSNAMVWTLSSGVYAYTGEPRAAIERAEKGLRLSPVDTQASFYLQFLALAHYVNGSYDESIIWGRKSRMLNPRLCSALRWLVGSLVASGRMEDARETARALLKCQPRFNIADYERWCPLVSDLRATFLERLESAGVPRSS